MDIVQGREWGKGKIGVTSEAEGRKKEASGDMILILFEYTQKGTVEEDPARKRGGYSIIGIITLQAGHDVGGGCDAAPPRTTDYLEGLGYRCIDCNETKVTMEKK